MFLKFCDYAGGCRRIREVMDRSAKDRLLLERMCSCRAHLDLQKATRRMFSIKIKLNSTVLAIYYFSALSLL